MKNTRNSNKLIIVIFALILSSLFGYDCLLRAAYESGDYKNPYSGFERLDFKNFDIVDIVSSTAANVKFVQGPFSVKIDGAALDYVKLKQEGRHLQINAAFKDQYYGNSNPYLLVISCPNLTELNTSAIYEANKKISIDTVAREDWNMRQVLIDGFKQDSLSICQDYGSTIILANNTIRAISAIVGRSPKSGSSIVVLKNNVLQETNFDIRNKSQLILDDATITNLKYHLTDSARLVLTGAAQNLIKK